ncbi:winged helix DNA-binding domain-containing protein [Cellulomonas humilata]|uniref:Winged helix DNA-binding domain-containing protein n=1 Tax=Cellulomonas humilata TaxID=144055 RepID=A0A7Y5ZXQ4_9CELL|nr:winged helix DNA-binding domain-containing protein [Cellulomonas humilata]
MRRSKQRPPTGRDTLSVVGPSLRKVHHLSRADARRIAVRAQRLTADRPTDVHETVRALTFLQLNPTSAIAPSADLVLWSRLGSSYDPQELADALDEQTIIEFRGMLRVAEDLALYRAEMAVWPGTGTRVKDWQRGNRQWVADNEACRQDILELLRADGPLPISELPDTCVRPWKSSGWNNNRNVIMLLGLMVQMGDVAPAGGTGRDRLWDLAERVYPPGPPVPLEEAYRIRDERRLAALGIARPKGPEQPVEPLDVRDVGEPAVIEGVRGEWRVDPAQLDLPFEGRAALLSPLDLLLYDRKRMTDVFEFDYILEMYKPVAARRWGYFALPVLVGDRLVGKLDATADVKAGVLRVHAVHEDEPWTPDARAAVDREIDDLAQWLELDLLRSS